MTLPRRISTDGRLGPATRLDDGTLFLTYAQTENVPNKNHLEPAGPQILMGRISEDNGETWSAPYEVLTCPEAPGAVLSPVAYADETGLLWVFWLRFYGADSEGDPAKSRCELWFSTSVDNGQTWRERRQIDYGHTYTGAINSVVRLCNGRMLVPLSYMSTEANSKYVCTVMFSDDNGQTWRHSEDIKIAPGSHPAVHNESGAIEPIVIELLDGPVWMLIRTQTGFLFESVSEDGAKTWSTPQPTPFVASNSPAAILRLTDQRLVIVWNNCNGDPLFGGVSYDRRALHAAVSDDDGKTWTHPVEINGRLPKEIDAGFSYPFLVEAEPGVVLVNHFRTSTEEDLRKPTGCSLIHVKFSVDWLGEQSAK